MNPSDQDTETRLLLNAYLDGELDAASSLAFDKRLAREPELAAERDRILAVKTLLRQSIPREAAPDRLRQAMMAQAGEAPIASGSSRRRAADINWRLALAAGLIGVLFGAGGATLALMPRSQPPAVAEVVADHLRAVLAPQPFDVASSDQHTVKPWFTGRLPFAPKVFDLKEHGFALVGGRVDVVAGEPAAALVFRHGKHLISLLSQPAGAAAIVEGTDRRGFLVRAWTDGAMRYWAVSDMAADELAKFESEVRARLAQTE